MNIAKFIDKELDKFLPSEKIEPKILHRAMRYSVFSGGKRIRPVIVIESARVCGGRAEDAVAAACSVELIHTYSLIHDDLPSMDNDDYRRGSLSCHKKFGEAAAILAGDALLTLAFNIIANEYAPLVAVKMAGELSSAAGSGGMVGGQSLDISGDKDLKRINLLKTARLFEVSASLGAISAHAGIKKLEALRKYGVNLGMAFQAIDDILDGDSSFSQAHAKAFIKRAKGALKIFGKKSERLSEIADSVPARDR